MSIDGLSGINLMLWFVMVAGDGVVVLGLVAVIAGDGWLSCDVSSFGLGV